nr:MAG TPA: hypothetical protein [Caudoviricetes sp.]
MASAPRNGAHNRKKHCTLTSDPLVLANREGI